MLMDISEATGRAMHRSDKSLFVGCMPAFAMKRLLPNLKDFCGKQPDISVRFWTVLTSNSFSRRDYDVAILYGAGDWPGCVARKISDEEIFPVCSPMLLRRQPRLRKPQDPQQHTAIRTAYSFILQDDWPLWLDAAGEKNLQFANEITFDLLLPALQAANDGLGVALGRSPLVSSDLAAKRLVFASDPNRHFTSSRRKIAMSFRTCGCFVTGRSIASAHTRCKRPPAPSAHFESGC